MRSSELFLQIREELANTQNQVEEGELSNLDGLIIMRQAKEQAEKVLEDVKLFEDSRINEIANDAEQYRGKYNGYEIKSVNGKKTYSFKGIEEIESVSKQVVSLQDKYKNAFEGVIKGTVQTVVDRETGVKYWVDADGQINPLPELNIGKSYITVKQVKDKK